MEVHICDFNITLHQTKISPTPPNARLEAVWRSEKGEIIIQGAVKPIARRGVATFN